jgi:hypothetical protein
MMKVNIPSLYGRDGVRQVRFYGLGFAMIPTCGGGISTPTLAIIRSSRLTS